MLLAVTPRSERAALAKANSVASASASAICSVESSMVMDWAFLMADLILSMEAWTSSSVVSVAFRRFSTAAWALASF